MNLIIAIELALLAGLMWMVLRKLHEDIRGFIFWDTFDEELHRISHDLQQIKTRQRASQKRERKDLKAELPITTSTNKTTKVKYIVK